MWASIQPLLAAMTDDETRFVGVTRLGVDEHVWNHVSERPTKDGGRGLKKMTAMADRTPDAHGNPTAQLLDLVPASRVRAIHGHACHDVVPDEAPLRPPPTQVLLQITRRPP